MQKMKSVLSCIGRAIRKLYQKPLIFNPALALLIELVVEMLSRQSVWQGFIFVFIHPGMYLWNALIILLTLTISHFFKHRVFFLSVISTLWILLGLANCIILNFRTTPLAAVDFQIVETAFKVVKYYLHWYDFVLIGVLFVCLGLIMAMIWRKAPKSKRAPILCAGTLLGLTAAVLLGSTVITNSAKTNGGFGNLVAAYKNYGFPYCFAYSIFDKGIDRPSGYDEASVQELMTRIDPVSADRPDRTPNIVFVQLESFFDANLLQGVTLGRDPNPTFTQLQNICISGNLTVPSAGAGTANTEFEVLSGMAVACFGAGEYPYKTILKDSACDSMCTYLHTYGYSATAIHNNVGLFYERMSVFPMLGFDRFISSEYMRDVTLSPNGWIKDAILTEHIVQAMRETAGNDLVFTITVQGHGRYLVDPGAFPVSGIDDPNMQGTLAYFLGQLSETDAFIAELIQALSQFDEDVVLVLYGDHLPALEAVTAETLATRSMYQTQYVIWSNFGLTGEDRDLTSYQLSTYVFALLGMQGNTMNRLHRSRESLDDYSAAMEQLQYDLLYGKSYATGGVFPKRNDMMTMGHRPSVINAVSVDGSTLTIAGTEFTEACTVTLNGRALETEYVSQTCLKANLRNKEPVGEIRVYFSGDDDIVLSETEPYLLLKSEE